MTTSIYRKYRPQFFAEVVGQEHVTNTLQQEIIMSKLAHAYLFCGMRGIGKTTVARLLAKAVNCERRGAKQSEPCNTCTSCQAINNGRSLDLIEIDAASNRRIDDVREIREHIPYSPSQARYKVVIIDEVHMLTSEAFNALLKTLEEPPAHVLFVLCTTEIHKIPETIISRCQRFDFVRLNSNILMARLKHIAHSEGIKVDDGVLRQIIELAGGSSRDAEGYLGKLLSLGEKDIGPEQASLVLPKADLAQALEFVNHLVMKQPGPALAILNELVEQGGDVAYFYRQVLNLMRQMLLLKVGGQMANNLNAELVPDMLAKLQTITAKLTQNRLNNMTARWLRLEGSWRSSDIWQLPLELATIEITEFGSKQADEQHNLNETTVRQAELKPVNKSANNQLSLEQVNSRWSELVTNLRDYNHSLSFILSVAEPLKLEGDTLTVGFSYELHLARVKDAKVATVVEQALEKIFGTRLRLNSVAQQSKGETGNLLQNVLTTFGGSIEE